MCFFSNVTYFLPFLVGKKDINFVIKLLGCDDLNRFRIFIVISKSNLIKKIVGLGIFQSSILTLHFPENCGTPPIIS